MGLLGLLPLFAAVFCFAPNANADGDAGTVAVHDQAQTEALSQDDKVALLRQLIDESGSSSLPDSSLLRAAEAALSAGDESLANRYLISFIEANEKVLQTLQDPGFARPDARELMRYAIATNPAGVRKGYEGVVLNMASTAFKVQQATMDQKLTTLNEIGRKLAFINTARQKRAVGLLADSLSRLATALKSADAETLIAFSRYKNDLFYRYDQAITSMGNRWSTAEARAQDISDTVDRFIQTKKFYLNSQGEVRILDRLSDQERDAQILYEVYLTKENVSLAVASAVAVAELTCMAATAGACAVAAPGMIGTVTTAVRGASSVYAATVAAADITDNYRFGGIKGLISLSTAIDTLVLMVALPRPTLTMMKWAPQMESAPAWLNAGLSKLQVFRGLAQAQYQAGYMLLVGGTGYGIWQITQADRISKDLEKAGQHLTPQEIRKRGALSVALGIFGGLRSYQEYKKGVELYGDDYKEMLAPATAGPTLQRLGSRFAKLLPWNPPIGMVKNVMEFKSAPWLSSLRFVGNAGSLAYDAVFYTSVYWMSYAYLDFLFEERSEPLPDLAPGEIALTLNGIPSDDLLYYAFKSNASKRQELERYQEGVNFFDDDFATPMEFLDKIRTYSKKYGKIKYLRITAHGLPGRFYASGDAAGVGGDYIGEEFILKNRNLIRNISRNAFSPDVKVRVVSCLVGANLKKPMEYKPDSDSKEPGEKFDVDAGDRFIKAFGENFLVNGGTVDSSRRVIMAVKDGYGAAIDYALDTLMMDALSQDQSRQELEEWKREIEAAAPRLMLPGDGKSPATGDDDIEGAILVKTIKRLKKMYTRMPELISKFGHNIEGNWFSDKHRKDYFPPQP